MLKGWGASRRAILPLGKLPDRARVEQDPRQNPGILGTPFGHGGIVIVRVSELEP